MNGEMIRGITTAVLRSPVGCLAIGMAGVAGGIGAAYPTALLAAESAPGLVAGVILGVCGAAVASLLWAVPLAASFSAGGEPASTRTCLHARGLSQIRIRAVELAGILAAALLVALAGALGGLASSLAQQLTEHSMDVGVAEASSIQTTIRLLLLVVVATSLGWALGVAAGRPVIAFSLYAGAIAATVLLAGATYFAPDLRYAAALTPFSALFDSARGEFADRQFTGGTSEILQAASVVLWASVLLATVARRLGQSVR